MDEMYNNQTPNPNTNAPIDADSTPKSTVTSENTDVVPTDTAKQAAEAVNEQPTEQNKSYTYHNPGYHAVSPQYQPYQGGQTPYASARPQYQNYQPAGSYTYQSNPYNHNTEQTRVQSAPPFATAKAEPKSKRFSLATVIVSVVLAVLLSGILSTGICMVLMADGDKSGQSKPNSDHSFYGNTNTTITNNTDNYVEAVAAKVQPSVVGIRTTYKYATQNFFGGSSINESGNEGSGVIYTSDGYIITNKHVIDRAITYNGEINVYLQDKIDTPYKASVIGYDASVDLAIIKIDETNLPAAEIGTSSDLKVGQNTVAVGCPGGLDFIGSVSVGYISGLNRKLTVDSATMNLIQTDTAINPGNSGGALVDNEGKLIGITNAKLVDEEFEGMGFAIPVDTVIEICDGIIAGKDEPKPYIGVQINTSYTADILERYDYPAGAVVESVNEGGPADKAGMKQYDIIVSVGDHNVTNYDTLTMAISKYKVGDTVKFRVFRDGKYINLEVTLSANS